MRAPILDRNAKVWLLMIVAEIIVLAYIWGTA